MMEEPDHTLNADEIRRYKELYKDRRTIENGNVVTISTDIALRVMMSGYDDFLDRNNYEKDRMTERTLCDGRKMTNLPQYVFGIVVQGTVDATNDNFLQFFEIDLFGELLLRNYGIDCVCNCTFWEYDVQLAKRSQDNTRGDIWKFPDWNKMFQWHPTEGAWVKRVCTLCRTTTCLRLRHFDYLAGIYSRASYTDNIGDNTKRVILCTWYKAVVGREVSCVERKIRMLFPNERNEEDRGYITNKE